MRHGVRPPLLWITCVSNMSVLFIHAFPKWQDNMILPFTLHAGHTLITDADTGAPKDTCCVRSALLVVAWLISWPPEVVLCATTICLRALWPKLIFVASAGLHALVPPRGGYHVWRHYRVAIDYDHHCVGVYKGVPYRNNLRHGFARPIAHNWCCYLRASQRIRCSKPQDSSGCDCIPNFKKDQFFLWFYGTFYALGGTHFLVLVCSIRFLYSTLHIILRL
jgi:hypothetical protein